MLYISPQPVNKWHWHWNKFETNIMQIFLLFFCCSLDIRYFRYNGRDHLILFRIFICFGCTIEWKISRRETEEKNVKWNETKSIQNNWIVDMNVSVSAVTVFARFHLFMPEWLKHCSQPPKLSADYLLLLFWFEWKLVDEQWQLLNIVFEIERP